MLYLRRVEDSDRIRDTFQSASRVRPVTLLTATRDLGLSQAAVLAGLLREAR